VNGTVNAIAVASDGKILIGGDFTTVNGKAKPRIARLHADGSVDDSFNLAAGPNGAVNAILIARGKIYIGGDFTMIGTAARARVARLEFDGSFDAGFDPGIGPDGPVYALAGQSNGQILIGGNFQTVNGFTTPGIARLNGEEVTVGEVQISGVRAVGSNVQFTFSSEVGLTYVIEGSDDLNTWQTIETRTASATSTNFSSPISGQRKFYRIRVNP
jgi:hypothetical protein